MSLICVMSICKSLIVSPPGERMGSNGNTAFVWVVNFPSAIPGLQYFSPGIFPWEEIPLLLLRNNSRNAHLQICATSKKKKSV